MMERFFRGVSDRHGPGVAKERQGIVRIKSIPYCKLDSRLLRWVNFPSLTKSLFVHFVDGGFNSCRAVFFIHHDGEAEACAPINDANALMCMQSMKGLVSLRHLHVRSSFRYADLLIKYMGTGSQSARILTWGCSRHLNCALTAFCFFLFVFVTRYFILVISWMNWWVAARYGRV